MACRNISSTSINSCDIMGISIDIVFTLKQLAWLAEASSNRSKPVRSSSSVHGIIGNRVVYHTLLSLDVDEGGCVIQIRVD